MIPYTSPLKETVVVQFEDTLSEQDCKNFDLIYESLLLEGKAGNLADLAVDMMLAEKPPAWLSVIHGRLQHLIISSKAFQEKRKLNMMLELKLRNLGLVREKERGNILKELVILE